MKNSYSNLIKLLSIGALTLMSACEKETVTPDCIIFSPTKITAIKACDPSMGGTIALCASLPPETLYAEAQVSLLGTCALSYLKTPGGPQCNGDGVTRLYSGTTALFELRAYNATNDTPAEPDNAWRRRVGTSIQVQILFGKCGLK